MKKIILLITFLVLTYCSSIAIANKKSPQADNLKTRFSVVRKVFYTFLHHQKWTGVDESVVEKFAKEQGREARSPLINTDQGDLLLFVFLLAGSTGGFLAGYYWKTLTLKG